MPRSAPGKLEPVFQAILENAVRICEANFGNLYLYEGGALRIVASHNVPPAYIDYIGASPVEPGRGTAHGRALLEGVRSIASAGSDQELRRSLIPWASTVSLTGDRDAR